MASPPFIISYSKVSAFRQCRKRYWFRYLSGEEFPPELKNVPGLIGNAVHRAMRVLVETNRPALARNEADVYLRMPGNEMCGEGTDAYSRVMRYIEAGVDVHQAIPSTASWAEKDVVTPPSATVELRARADRVDRLASGGWQVIDWKTGGDFDDSTDEQLDISHVAMRSAFRGIMDKEAEVTTVAWNLRRKADDPHYGPRVRILRRGDALATMGRYHAIARSMRETTEFPAIPGLYCSFCEWRERCPEAYSGLAEGWDDGEFDTAEA